MVAGTRVLPVDLVTLCHRTAPGAMKWMSVAVTMAVASSSVQIPPAASCVPVSKVTAGCPSSTHVSSMYHYTSRDNQYACNAVCDNPAD